MNTNGKFLFETEFSLESAARPDPEPEPVEEVEPEPEPEPEPTFSEEEMAAAREVSYAEGLNAGLQQAREELEGVAAKALESLAAQMGPLGEAQAAGIETCRRQASELAFLIADKLASALIERSPLDEVTALVEDCLVDLYDEPRVVIRASEEICDALRDRTSQLTAASGFPGQLVLLPDDGMTGADCRIEWADGGAERNMNDIRAKIDEAVKRYIQAH